MRDRTPCCTDPKNRCGTDWNTLTAWVTRVTGKGYRLVELQGDEQGKMPFFAQPVGFDGRHFYVAKDGLCDTEKLMHEACHFLTAPKQRRNKANYGLGPGPFRDVDDREADNEEVSTSLFQMMIAPCFGLPEHKMPRPDYNCASRRNIDWEACEARALETFERVRDTLPPGALTASARPAGRRN